LRDAAVLGEVSHVLFLRNVSEQRFERVGIGYLFGEEAERSWERDMAGMPLIRPQASKQASLFFNLLAFVVFQFSIISNTKNWFPPLDILILILVVFLLRYC